MKDSTARKGGLLSVREAAERIGVSSKAVYAWTYRKQPLTVQRDGRRVFVHVEDLEAFLNAKLPKPISTEPSPNVENENTIPVPEDPAHAPDMEVANAIEQPKTGSGQRDYLPRRQIGPPILVIYAGFEFAQ
jgi:excisionase family DNA binding protein